MKHWHDFLRRERQSKINSIEMLSTGRVRLGRTEAGVTRDTTQEALDKDKLDLAEIEELLTSAGEPLD